MAKRYGQGSPMKQAEMYRKEEAYAGYDNKMRMEARDYDMITEDHSAIANLPQEVHYKMYAKPDYTMDSNLNDRISGIDEQIKMDHSGMKRHEALKKY